MLQEMDIPIENLLLDPNNPRFICDLTERTKVPDDQIMPKQDETLKRFASTAANDADFDVTNIRDLYYSMLRIGFVGIDRVVVRPISGSNYYLVLEGNRRIATVKSILGDFQNALPPLNRPSERTDAQTHMASFKKVRAMLLDTAGFTPDEIDQKVAVLLGIRHHGSVLEWEPLPKAYNIYTEYMTQEPRRDSFSFENKKAKEVANRLCIQTSDVKSALRIYVAYLQVRERFPEVRDDHFSLIEYGIKDKTLQKAYFEIDEGTFALDEKSLTKLNGACQFAVRDSNSPDRTTNGKKKIIRNPQQFKLLGRLIDKMQRASHPAVKTYAGDLIQRVENEDDLDMTLDQAVDDLTAFEKRTEWADAIAKLLQKQQADLPIEKYTGEGLDRGRKDELKTTLGPLRLVMNI
jgi:hypothetical protein